MVATRVTVSPGASSSTKQAGPPSIELPFTHRLPASLNQSGTQAPTVTAFAVASPTLVAVTVRVNVWPYLAVKRFETMLTATSGPDRARARGGLTERRRVDV